MIKVSSRSSDAAISDSGPSSLSPSSRELKQLCHRLSVLLRGNPQLDDSDKKVLVEVTAAVEGVLGRCSCLLSLAAPTTSTASTVLIKSCCNADLTPSLLCGNESSSRPSESRLAIATLAICGGGTNKSSKAPRYPAAEGDVSRAISRKNSSSFAGTTVGVVQVKRRALQQKHRRSKRMAQPASWAPHDDRGRMPPEEARKQYKALFATYPYTELSLEESNDTVMERLLGRSAAFWWKRCNRRSDLWGMWITSALAWISGLYLSFGPKLGLDITDEDDEGSSALRGALAGIFVIAVSWLCLTFTSLMNSAMVKRCAAVYETHLLMGEMFVFSCSYFVLLGHSFFSALSGLGVFGGFCSVFLFYDSFSVAERPRLRYVQLFNLVAFTLSLAFIYVELGENFRPYRLNLVHGFVLEDREYAASLGDGSSSKSLRNPELSFALKDFCLNRGCTIFLMVLKLVYSSFRHPEDCVIIKSRVRSTETAIASQPENHEAE